MTNLTKNVTKKVPAGKIKTTTSKFRATAEVEVVKDPADKRLTYPEEIFVREYMKDFNIRTAGRRAGYNEQNARDLLQMPHIRKHMDEITTSIGEQAEIDGAVLVKKLFAIATASLDEFIEHFRGSCRYCWGHDPKNPAKITHEFQYRSKRERIKAREKFKASINPTSKKKRVFENGGLGYDKMRSPNINCPECHGDGISNVVVKDTNISSASRHLVNQVFINSAGKVELKMHDQVRVMELLMKHLGMFTDKTETDVKVQIIGGLQAQLDEWRKQGITDPETFDTESGVTVTPPENRVQE